MTTTLGPVQALHQSGLPLERVLHSTNSGFTLHRVGQLAYEFAAEGRRFSVDLLKYINTSQEGVATSFAYEEAFGTRDRLHWFIHLKTPADYKILLDMVDHDLEFRRISDDDRLPHKGGGNWDRMFVHRSLHEDVLVPQHGMQGEDDDHDTGTFVPPASSQLNQKPEDQINSATAGAIVMRTSDVKYEFREEGRMYAAHWQHYVNEKLAGRVTATLYEQTWGQQDRLFQLVHLRSPEDYHALAALERSKEMAEEVFARPRVHESKGGGTWDRLFIPASIKDTLLLPHATSSDG
ncbi:hypothetical protein FHS29_000346 [Saccharothrix tamanrassetensis]|uniref:Uncharacterized protein n=1 Tax=Saccharothrix tamanrassetensis TaxID=1051531 RepID=A0A841CDE4_9PSEU|nr:DUF6039 family protein [Saccharothrix tamanrassetensis]MBB5953776.1 hypothetical protein [Saccharothrix tamanrassetensis]